MTLLAVSPAPSNRDGKNGTKGSLLGSRLIPAVPGFLGRPVLAEDTGFSNYLPSGEGLAVFNDMAGAVAGAKNIAANYERHRRSARDLAEEYLDSRRCLGDMLCASDL